MVDKVTEIKILGDLLLSKLRSMLFSSTFSSRPIVPGLEFPSDRVVFSEWYKSYLFFRDKCSQFFIPLPAIDESTFDDVRLRATAIELFMQLVRYDLVRLRNMAGNVDSEDVTDDAAVLG